ncbi:MAG: MFS transporter, partial [Promethearchaeota archaeon]
MIGDSYPPEARGKKFGLMHIAIFMGLGLGNIIGAVITNTLGPIAWRYTYGIGSILSFIPLINYFFSGFDPERGRSDPELQDFKGKIAYDYKITFHNLVQVFKRKSNTGILLYEICAGIQGSALTTWTIFYLTSLIDIPNAIVIATTVSLLGGLGAIVGTVFGGRMGDSLYRTGRLRGRVLISSVGLIVGILFVIIFYTIPFHTSTHTETILFTVIFITVSFAGSLFTSLCVGNIFAIFSEVSRPELRSIANALLGVFFNIGGVIGQFIVATLVGIDMALLQFSILLVLSVWVCGTAFWIITFIYYPKESKELRNIMAQRRKELDQSLENTGM